MLFGLLNLVDMFTKQNKNSAHLVHRLSKQIICMLHYLMKQAVTKYNLEQ